MLPSDRDRYVRVLAIASGLLLAGILSLVAFAAHAAPICYGGEDGCTPYRVAHYPGGMCAVWYQPGAIEWEVVGYCVKYADLAPDEKGSFADMWLGDPKLRDVLWPSQVTRELDPVEQAALASLIEPAPPSLYVVKPTVFGSRPTYPLFNGLRGSRSNGRVNVGEPCSCQFRDGDYCEVAPGSVALCDRRPQ